MGKPGKQLLTDRELGIRTTRNVRIQKLEIASANREHGHEYQPTPYGVLEDMLCGLGLDYPRFVFVDLGCGKGRMICSASQYAFMRIVGVEFSKELHAVAVENVEVLHSFFDGRRCRDVRAVHGDAASFDLPLEPLVVYLFNPFGPAVLSRVLDRLQRSFDTLPRDIYVLYYMPEHERVMGHAPCLARVASARNWSVYKSRFTFGGFTPR